MPIDISGFVTPEQSWGGLDRVTNQLETHKAQEYNRKQIADARKGASTKYLTDYLDDKDKYTGTNYDPIRHALVSSSLDKALGMVSEGRDINDIMMSISKPVAQAGEYTLRAQKINDNLKSATEFLKNKKGIDINKFQEAWKRKAWEGKNIDEVDPDANYADAVLRDDDVFNREGFDEYVSKSAPNTYKLSTDVIGSDKRRSKKLLSVTAPSYMQPVIENGVFQKRFEPEHEIYTEGGENVKQPVINELTGEPVLGSDNKPLMEDVKMVMPDVFNNMINDPNAGSYLRQEIRKYIKQTGADMKSKQVESFGRVLAFKLLDESAKSKSGFTEIVEQKAAPAPVTKNYINLGKDTESSGVVGNVLNTLEVSATQKDGEYNMVGKGNKKNLADIQLLLEDVLSPTDINDNDPERAISYEIKNGQVESITYNGIRYDRDFFQRKQEVYDKNPKWAGKLKYPTQQRILGGKSNTPKPAPASPTKPVEKTNIKTPVFNMK